LVIDGHTLLQSQAIMEYLDEVYPEPPILPKNDPFKRAEVRRICNVITSDIQPVQVYINLQKLLGESIILSLFLFMM